MSIDDLDIHPRIISRLKKANLQSFEAILSLSLPDIERATGLSASDVNNLKYAVSEAVSKPAVVTALDLWKGTDKSICPKKLSCGCPVIDKQLRGGIISRGITEVSGESASGKTQLCLQLCLTVQLPEQNGGLRGGAVYVSTEDVFPNKRLQQMIYHFKKKWTASEIQQPLHLGDNIYIEHVADLEGLMFCVHKKFPILLAKGLVRLIVIDSVAALFRCEFGAGETVKRAKQMASFAAHLHRLGSQYNIPIVCVNQVSANLSSNNTRGSVLPALGLSWANQITSRFMLRRTPQKVVMSSASVNGLSGGNVECAVREFEVMFAPHLSAQVFPFVVDQRGVSGLE